MIAIVAVVAVIAIGAGAMLMLGGDDGDGKDGSGDGATLTKHPTLDASGITFPDARALRYDEGAEAACEAVSETMTARGYEFESASNNDGGIDCWYAAPAAASFEKGTYYFRTNVYMAAGAVAQDAYDSFFSAISSNQESGGSAETTWSPLYEFPVGEEGWIVHNQDADRGDGTASFRKGDTTFYVTAFGWIEQGEQDKPLSEEITFREITDIVTALGGGKAGEAQISESAAQEYPGGLPDFGEPLPPVEGSAEERCAALTDVATNQLDSQPASSHVDSDSVIPSFGCTYEPAETAYEKDHVGIRNTQILIEDYSTSEADYAAGALGRHLRFLMEESFTKEEGAGPLYELPAGASGFVITRDDGYGHSALKAGYVVGDYHVKITLGGFYSGEGFDTRPLTEEELIGDLTKLLNAMNG